VNAVLSKLDVEIVKHSDRANGFTVLPKRWVVERTLARLNRCRRLSKDWENLNHKARAFLMMAVYPLHGQEAMSCLEMFPERAAGRRAHLGVYPCLRVNAAKDPSMESRSPRVVGTHPRAPAGTAAGLADLKPFLRAARQKPTPKGNWDW
jgi:hypothetical protein